MTRHIFCRPRRATGWRAAVGIEEGRRRASAGTSAARRCRAIAVCEVEPPARDGAVRPLTFAVGAARALRRRSGLARRGCSAGTFAGGSNFTRPGRLVPARLHVLSPEGVLGGQGVTNSARWSRNSTWTSRSWPASSPRRRARAAESREEGALACMETSSECPPFVTSEFAASGKAPGGAAGTISPGPLCRGSDEEFAASAPPRALSGSLFRGIALA